MKVYCLEIKAIILEKSNYFSETAIWERIDKEYTKI